MLTTLAFGRIGAIVIKEIVGRPRPTGDLVHVMEHLESYSFPSGHVMHYVVFCGLLTFILGMRVRRGRQLKMVQIAFVVGLVAMSVSRIYLGAHLASDVLGAYGFGAVVLIGAVWVWRHYEDRMVRGGAGTKTTLPVKDSMLSHKGPV